MSARRWTPIDGWVEVDAEPPAVAEAKRAFSEAEVNALRRRLRRLVFLVGNLRMAWPDGVGQRIIGKSWDSLKQLSDNNPPEEES